MIPDLGKYAGAVLGSYAASIILLILVAAWSLWRATRVARALREVEARVKKDV
jgi:heme exporter protein D